MPVTLSLKTLSDLPETVGRPGYSRDALRPGIVHFGVGNFHRSHQAVYLDDLFNTGEGHDWALVGAGVFDGEKAGRASLEAQDWLTTVVEQDAGHRQARVTGVMIDFLTPGDTQAIIDQLADPRIRIVSMTIT
jgi:mannitol 2-dehydrogenase